MSIRTKLFGGFGLLVVVFAVTVVFANTQLKSVGASETEVFTRDLDLTWRTGQIQLEIRHLRAEQIQYILARTPKESEEYSTKLIQYGQDLDKLIGDIIATGSLTPTQSQMVTDIRANTDKYRELVAQNVVGNVRSGNVNAAIDETFAGKSKDAFKLALDIATKLAGDVRANGAASHASVQSTLSRSQTLLLATSGLMLVGAAGVALLLTRSIAGRVRKLTAISDRLSRGEVDGLTVDVSGSDEVGRLGDSLKGVLAAFEVMRDEAMANEAHPQAKAS